MAFEGKSLIALSFLAYFFGIKHSFDADHLVAVSNLLTRARSPGSALKMSLYWALGHMATASLITLFLFFIRREIPLLAHAELAVSVMLIFIGLFSLAQFRFHAHPHRHGEVTHTHWHFHQKSSAHEHRHMVGIGIIHGLASHDELLLLFTITLKVTSLPGMLFSLLLFSVGVVSGMALFAYLFTFPLVRIQADRLRQALLLATGFLSMSYGLWIASAYIFLS